MRTPLLLFTILPIVTVGAIAGCFENRRNSTADSRGASGSAATLPSPKVVSLGRLEPARGVITIGALPGERLEKLLVTEGQPVEKGHLLAQLESYRSYAAEVQTLENRRQVAPQRWQSQLVVAEARVRQAQAALEQAKAKEQEVELQRSMLPLMARQAQRAEVTYYRLTDMADNDASLASDRELERYELLRDKANIDHDQAVRRYELAKVVAEKGVEAATADVRTAEASLEELRLANPEPEIADQITVATIRRDMAQLRAPLAGRVLKVFLKEGEVITDRPVMQIADLDEMVCIAEVYEADAKDIRAADSRAPESASAGQTGDVVRIVSMAFREEFADGIWGTVEHVGSLVAPPGLQSRNPLAPADRSVVEVHIRIGIDGQASAERERLNRAYVRQAADLVSLQVRVEFFDRGMLSQLPVASPAESGTVVDSAAASP